MSADLNAKSGPPPGPPSGPPEALTLQRLCTAIFRCVRFYSRLPTPTLPWETDKHAIPDFRVEPLGLPIAALIIALPACLVLALCGLVRLDPLLTAALVLSGQSASGLF